MERAFEFNVLPAAPQIYFIGKRIGRVFMRTGKYKASGFDEETNRATVIRPVTCSVQWSGNEEYDKVHSADQTCESYAHQVFISMFPTLNANHL